MEYLKREPVEQQQFPGNIDILGLGDTVYVLLEQLWGEEWGNFTMENPLRLEPKDITFPTITYQLKELTPGVINNKGDRERKPRTRKYYEVPNEQTGEMETVEDQAQVMDAEVEFIVFGQSNLEATELSQSFMEVIQRHKGLLMKHGLRNIWFEKEEPHEEGVREIVYGRSITYKVKFERIYHKVHTNIERIIVEVDTLHDKLAKEGKLPSQAKTQGGKD